MKQVKLSRFFSQQPRERPGSNHRKDDAAIESPSLGQDDQVPYHGTTASETISKHFATCVQSSFTNRFSKELQQFRSTFGKSRSESPFISEHHDQPSSTCMKRKAPESLRVSHVLNHGSDILFRGSKRLKSPTFTPLQEQFLQLKKSHEDCILLFEVGYKFRFFGEDAVKASKALNIIAFMDHDMLTASIPAHRLQVHVKKLVNLGYRVAIGRQIETAALKAESSSKNTLFQRRVTEIYTKSTMIFNDGEHEDKGDDDHGNLFFLVEETRHEKTRFGILALNLHVGTFIYDEFEDQIIRSNLLWRLESLNPIEIIASESHLSVHTQSILFDYKRSASYENPVLLDFISCNLEQANVIRSISEYFSSHILEMNPASQENQSVIECAELVHNLPPLVKACFAMMLSYLKRFHLESTALLAGQFTQFQQRYAMNLDPRTLRHLSVLQNQTVFSKEGTLLSVLDRTKSILGRRKLMEWLTRPLTEKRKIQERHEAIDDLILHIQNDSLEYQDMRALLSKIPDLHKKQSRIFYQRATCKDVVEYLRGLQLISSLHFDGLFESESLRSLFQTFQKIYDRVMALSVPLHLEKNVFQTPADLFRDFEKYPTVSVPCLEGKAIVEQLDEELVNLSKQLEIPLSFKTVGGIEFLIEVPNHLIGKLPSSWIKISSTKSVSRFHTKKIIQLIQKRDCAFERFNAEVDILFKKLQRDIAEELDSFRKVLIGIAELDVLLSLAEVAFHGQYVKPQIDEEPVIQVLDARHPVMEQSRDSFVSNDIDLSETKKCLLLTGPNMAGKSTFARQVAVLVIMAQIGSFLPAREARIGILDGIFVRMGASDDLFRHRSTFMNELQETNSILRSATHRSLVILDELGRGTSTFDGTAIAYGTLKYLLENIQCLSIFITHYPCLAQVRDELKSHGLLDPVYMDYLRAENNDENPFQDIIFLYKLVPGVSDSSFGIHVAKMAGLPSSVLVRAAEKSQVIRNRMESSHSRKLRVAFEQVYRNFLDCL